MSIFKNLFGKFNDNDNKNVNNNVNNNKLFDYFRKANLINTVHCGEWDGGNYYYDDNDIKAKKYYKNLYKNMQTSNAINVEHVNNQIIITIDITNL